MIADHLRFIYDGAESQPSIGNLKWSFKEFFKCFFNRFIKWFFKEFFKRFFKPLNMPPVCQAVVPDAVRLDDGREGEVVGAGHVLQPRSSSADALEFQPDLSSQTCRSFWYLL